MRCILAALMALVIAAPAHAITYEEATYCIGGKPLRLQIADTPEKREYGLMNRTSLAPYDGMYFVFDHSYYVQMWMKDTPLSLDMLFVDEAGKVVHSVSQTTPGSEAIIATPERAAAVIELEGGRAEREGIEKGADVVRGYCPAARR